MGIPLALEIRREFLEKVMPELNPKGGDSRMALPGRGTNMYNWGLRGQWGWPIQLVASCLVQRGSREQGRKWFKMGPEDWL